MSDVGVGVFLAAGLLGLMVFAFILGGDSRAHEIVKQCETFGGFYDGDAVYKCEARK